MGKRTQKGDETIMPENSIALNAEQRDAYRLDAELKHHALTVVEEMIEVGRCLKEINDRRLYQYLDTSTFAEYAEKAVGLKERAAYNYITAYETYGSDGLQKYGQLGITKLVALAQLNDTDREEMLESGKAEELSTRELKEEIKKLKGENDQLRFQFDDITDNVKKQDAEIADKDAEIENLKNQLEEAQRPVVASMTNEEKEEIRREAEKKARADAEREIKSLQKKVEAAEKNVRDLDKINDKHTSEIAELSEKLDAAKAENEKLHANAEKSKAAPSGNKELLKYHFAALQNDYIKAVEVLGRFEPEEREKFKAALVKIAEDIKAAAEKM